jgi:hypothetical protein
MNNFLEKYGEGSEFHEESILKNPNVHKEKLDTAAKHGNWKIRQIVASHPKATHDNMSTLLNDENVNVRCATVKNPKAT